MDKITTNTTCTCCEQDTILRIVAGNDFSLRLTLTYKDGDVTRQYDMTDAEDLIVNVVSPNGNRTELDSTVDEFGNVTAVVDAQSLESYVPYGIEVLWRDDVYDKRAAAPNLFSFVNSSREANDAQDVIVDGPYDYNLEIISDVAYVSVGEIPEIDMTVYVTHDQLDEYSYVSSSDLTTTLGDYVTTSSLNTTLNDYATTNYVDDAVSHIDLTNYYDKSEIDAALQSYVNDAEYDSTNHNILLKNDNTTIATIDASPFIIDGMVENVEVSNGNLVISFNTDAGKQDITIPISDIFDASNYYTSSQIDGMLTNYASQLDMTTVQGDITSLDGRVTTLENNPSVPSNVVTSDDGNEIVCLTQSQYDTLEQNQQLDPNVFYYITDTTSNYVTNSSLTTTLQDYATTQYVNTAISGVTIDETNLVHKSGAETITGVKTFTADCIYNNSQYSITFVDNFGGIAKTSNFGRSAFNQACLTEVLLPISTRSDSSWSFQSTTNELPFYTITGGPTRLNKTQVAKIDNNGIYEGTTLLSNKYASITDLTSLDDRVTAIEQGGSSSGVSEEDWDNSNEALAQELLDNRLEHQTINSNFSNYYTKTETDSRYATTSSANSKFVTQSDDLNRQQAIAAAFGASVQSTTVHNIWTGSQNDYDAITTKDTNTLYVIL